MSGKRYVLSFYDHRYAQFVAKGQRRNRARLKENIGIAHRPDNQHLRQPGLV